MLASYGTTRQDARRRDIEPLARELFAAAPGAGKAKVYAVLLVFGGYQGFFNPLYLL